MLQLTFSSFFFGLFEVIFLWFDDIVPEIGHVGENNFILQLAAFALVFLLAQSFLMFFHVDCCVFGADNFLLILIIIVIIKYEYFWFLLDSCFFSLFCRAGKL